MATKDRVRLIYAATAIAVLSMAGGMVLAAVLTSTPVTQTANFYQGGSGAVPGYSTPTLTVSTTPVSTTTCTSGTIVGASNGGTSTLILSATTGNTVCTAGNFAEEFSFAFSETLSSTQTNTITVTTQVNSNSVQTNSEMITLGTGSPFTQTVDVFVDYGAINPPAGGITVLDVVVQ
jgi:hypothetical protein